MCQWMQGDVWRPEHDPNGMMQSRCMLLLCASCSTSKLRRPACVLVAGSMLEAEADVPKVVEEEQQLRNQRQERPRAAPARCAG